MKISVMRTVTENTDGRLLANTISKVRLRVRFYDQNRFQNSDSNFGGKSLYCYPLQVSQFAIQLGNFLSNRLYNCSSNFPPKIRILNRNSSQNRTWKCSLRHVLFRIKIGYQRMMDGSVKPIDMVWNPNSDMVDRRALWQREIRLNLWANKEQGLYSQSFLKSQLLL